MADDALESNQQQLLTLGPGYRQRGKKAPHDVNLDSTDINLIILGKRNRKPKILNNYAIQSDCVSPAPQFTGYM
jgi:hypothetical protein